MKIDMFRCLKKSIIDHNLRGKNMTFLLSSHFEKENVRGKKTRFILMKNIICNKIEPHSIDIIKSSRRRIRWIYQ